MPNPFGATPSPRDQQDQPEPYCRCCGAFLRIEGHRADCESLPDQDAIERDDNMDRLDRMADDYASEQR